MPSIRRGVAPGANGDDDFCVCANAGAMESRNGRARATPAPRRKLRRSSALRSIRVIWELLQLGFYRLPYVRGADASPRDLLDASVSSAPPSPRTGNCHPSVIPPWVVETNCAVRRASLIGRRAEKETRTRSHSYYHDDLLLDDLAIELPELAPTTVELVTTAAAKWVLRGGLLVDLDAPTRLGVGPEITVFAYRATAEHFFQAVVKRSVLLYAKIVAHYVQRDVHHVTDGRHVAGAMPCCLHAKMFA